MNRRRFPRFLLAWLAGMTLAAGGGPGPDWIWGVTVDRVRPLGKIVDAVQALPRRPTVRVVLDNDEPPETYRELVDRLAPGADLMFELADSYDFRNLGAKALAAKTALFLEAFGPQAGIWEIGNEVNGSWLGPEDEVAAKVVATYDQVRARGGRTALTLYYGETGADRSPEVQMARWAVRHLPHRMLTDLDYVLVSYYEDDNPGLRRPDWDRVFRILGHVFPRCRFGLGETGAKKSHPDPDRVRRAYGLRVNNPRYVGGCFWWNFVTDMVPRTKPLWRVLATEMEAAR